jgi:endonuclease G
MDKPLKDRLYDALSAVPSAETRDGRTALLDGLPHNIRVGLTRSDNLFVDVTNLINQIDQLGRLDNGERPVVLLVHNARRVTRGSELGRLLEELQAEVEESYGFELPLAGLSDTPEVLIFGGEGEWVTNTFMEQAQTAGRRVARLAVQRHFNGQPAGSVGVGTGWLVAPRLMLTNYHVIEARGPKDKKPAAAADFKLQAENAIAWFDYHVAVEERREEQKHIEVAAIEVVASCRDLDYALLRLADSPELPDRQHMPLAAKNPPLQQGARLNIVQCPGGGPLRYAIRNNFYVGRGEQSYQVRYLTDTIPGSSGSPVLADSWQVVAMHRGYTEVNPQAYQDEGGKGQVAKYHNDGIAIHEILRQLPAEARKEVEAAQE